MASISSLQHGRSSQFSFINNETIIDKVINKVLSALGLTRKNNSASPFDPPSFFTKLCAFAGSKDALEKIKNSKIECVNTVYVVNPKNKMLVSSVKAQEVFRKNVVAVKDQTGVAHFAKTKSILNTMPFTPEGKIKEWAMADYDQRLLDCIDLLKFAPKEEIDQFLSGIVKLGGKNEKNRYNKVYKDLEVFYTSSYGTKIKKLDFQKASNPAPISSPPPRNVGRPATSGVHKPSRESFGQRRGCE